MRAFKWVLSLVGAAVLGAFLALSPPYLTKALERDPYRDVFENKRGDWTGVITLWHVVGFKPYQGSVTAYLESSFGSYEKKNPGVYIEVIGMDASGAAERMKRGERPDLWSFPSGALLPERLAPLTLDDVSVAFAGNLSPARWEGKAYAVPYLYSAYFLLGNTVRTQEANLAWPGNGEKVETALLQSALDMGGAKRRSQLSAPTLLAAYAGLVGTPAAEGDFKAGQVALLLGDGRALGDLQRKQTNGGFTFDARALPGFTDQVQYIGLDREINERKRPHGEALAALLLENRAQEKTAALGAMPAVSGLEGVRYAESALTAMYEACREPVAPNPFLWQRHKDALLEEAARALAGDTAAKAAFAARLQETLQDPLITPG